MTWINPWRDYAGLARHVSKQIDRWTLIAAFSSASALTISKNTRRDAACSAAMGGVNHSSICQFQTVSSN